MSSSEAATKPADGVQPDGNVTTTAEAGKPITSSAVFSMFGGGAKKEKKDEDEDRGDNSGSAKAQRDAAAAASKDAGEDDQPPESEDVQFVPVVHLTKQVEVKKLADSEDVIFKEKAVLYRSDETTGGEWKTRGRGDAHLVKNRETGLARFVMWVDSTGKLCANHSIPPRLELSHLKYDENSPLWFVPAEKRPEIAKKFREAFFKVQEETEPLAPKAEEEEEEEEKGKGKEKATEEMKEEAS